MTLGQGDHRFLPATPLADIGSYPLFLAGHVAGPNLVNFDLEELLDSFLDLQLVGPGINLDNNLIIGFLKPHTLLSQTGFLYHGADILHDSNLASS